MDPDTNKEYTDQDFPDLEPVRESPRTPKIQIVVSCIWGIFLATAIAGLLINRWPKEVQLSRFLILTALLAPTTAIVGHWVFVTHPNQIIDKLAKEEEARNLARAGDTDPERDDDPEQNDDLS
jgi:hypothetical protein